MAVDTLNRRAALSGRRRARLRPQPDGTVDAADRLQLRGIYPGLAAPMPVVVTARRPPHIGRKGRRTHMMRKIFEYPFQLTGAQTLLVNLEAYDLTRAEEITSEIEITAATTAAGDTLDIEFQESPDGVEWNTRIHHTAQVGNSGASLTTPESERITLLKWPAGTTDQIYEPTGSRGASDLAAPGVRHGPMLGRRPNRAATYRVKFVLVNSVSVGFSGTYTLWVDSEC